MKKLFTLIAILSLGIAAHAQVVFTENFTGYTDGSNLEAPVPAEDASYDFAKDWYVTFSQDNRDLVSPIVKAGALTYTDYVASGVGNKAVLAGFSPDDSGTAHFTHRRVITDGISDKLFVSFLVNVKDDSKRNSQRDFFSFDGHQGNTSYFPRGRVFAKIDDDGGVIFGVSKNSTSGSVIANVNNTFALNTTYLMVVVYEKVAGERTDMIRLYVNPVMAETEAAQAADVQAVSTDLQSDFAETELFIAIVLRQRNIAADISGIRVSKSWDALWAGDPVAVRNVENTTANITFNGQQLMLNNAQDGAVAIFDITGRQMLNEKVGVNAVLPLNLPSSVYVVKYVANDGSVETAKIIL